MMSPVAKPEPWGTSTGGYPYTQLFQYYPSLTSFYSQGEKEFRSDSYRAFALATWPTLPLFFVAVYYLTITYVPKFMADRKPYEWKTALALWNLALCLFSVCGMVRTVPHLLHRLANNPLRDTICSHAEGAYFEGAVGLWVMLFVFSKVAELIDTVFIVFRKSKLMFLHWYHHITVLLFCWHSYAYDSSSGLYFIAMNYTVHASMYGYYFLCAIKAWPKWLPASLITVAQISQMVIGTTICCMSYIYVNDGMPCSAHPQNILAGGLMYGSYLYLFTEFFVKRFIMPKRRDPKAKAL